MFFREHLVLRESLSLDQKRPAQAVCESRWFWWWRTWPWSASSPRPLSCLNMINVYQGGGPRQPPAGPDGGDGRGHGQLRPVWHPQDWPPRQLPRPSGPCKLPVKDQETRVSDTESSAIISTSGWQGRRKLNQVKLWVLSIRKFLHSWQFMSPSDTWLFLTCLDMNWLCMSG